jgi:MFS superfamily sulfate permease-like transporter
MGICLLDVSAWRRLNRMRLVDTAAFLITAFGVMMVNAVAAVLAGCAAHGALWAYRRYLRPARMPEVAARAQ